MTEESYNSLIDVGETLNGDEVEGYFILQRNLKKYMRLLMPNISKKITDYLVNSILLIHIFLTVFIMFAIILFVPMYLLDRNINHIYDKCDEKNIKPEFQPFCCDHKDPIIGMNCANFLLGFMISIVPWFILLVVNFANVKDSKISITLFITLFLSAVIFFIVYLSIGAVILNRSNADCYEMQKKTEAPKGYKYPLTPVKMTDMITIVFFVIFGLSILLSPMSNWMLNKNVKKK